MKHLHQTEVNYGNIFHDLFLQFGPLQKQRQQKLNVKLNKDGTMLKDVYNWIKQVHKDFYVYVG